MNPEYIAFLAAVSIISAFIAQIVNYYIFSKLGAMSTPFHGAILPMGIIFTVSYIQGHSIATMALAVAFAGGFGLIGSTISIAIREWYSTTN